MTFMVVGALRGKEGGWEGKRKKGGIEKKVEGERGIYMRRGAGVRVEGEGEGDDARGFLGCLRSLGTERSGARKGCADHVRKELSVGCAFACLCMHARALNPAFIRIFMRKSITFPRVRDKITFLIFFTIA